MNKQQTDDVEQTNAIILNKLRKLNSGITFKTAKDPEAPASQSSINKDSQPKSEAAESDQNPGTTETSDEEWLKEWKSKRSSICVISNKSTVSEEKQQNQEKQAKVYTCNFCSSTFEAQSSLIFHIPKCSKAPGNSDSDSESSQSQSKPNSALERLLGSVSISKKLSLPKGISITQASDQADFKYKKTLSPSQPEKAEDSPLQGSRPSTPKPTAKEKPVKASKRYQKSRSSTPEIGSRSLLEQVSDTKSTASLKENCQDKVLPHPNLEGSQPVASHTPVRPGTSVKAKKKQPLKQQRKKFKAAPPDFETSAGENQDQPVIAEPLEAIKSTQIPRSEEDFEGFSDPEFSGQKTQTVTRDPEFVPKSVRSAKSASKTTARKSARKRTKKRVVVDFVPDYSSSSNSPTTYTVDPLEKLPHCKNEDPTFSPPRVDGVGLDHSKNYQFRRERRASDPRACLRCGISDLGTSKDFEFHHLQHIIDKKLYVSLTPLPVKSGSIENDTHKVSTQIKSEPIKENRTLQEHNNLNQQSFSPQLTKTESPASSSDGESQSSAESTAESKGNSEETLPLPLSPKTDVSSPLEPKEDPELHLGETVIEEVSNKVPDPPLKLTLKISQSSDGKNKKTVSIVHKDTSSSVSDGSASDSEMNTAWNAHSSVETPLDQAADENSTPIAPLTASTQDPLSVNDSQTSEMKLPSIPQDNTMTNSGEVSNSINHTSIPDANSGANLTSLDNSYQSQNPPQNPSYEPQFESFTGDWMQDYDSGNRIAAAMAGTASTQSSVAQPPPQTNDTGLFSQAVLGSSPTYSQLPQPNVSQGSFEEFCLNDQYNSMSNNVGNMSQSQQLYNPVNQYPYPNVPTAPMHPSNDVNMNTPMQQNTIDKGIQNTYNRLPNSVSPIAGHLPPQSSEFPVPGYPNQTQQTTPPIASGQTPPLPAQPSPSQSNETATDPTVPRLTIANNLMAQTTVAGPPNNGTAAFSPQWTAPPNIPNLSQNFPQPSQPMAPPPRRGMPVAYRPSPRPRIRGRPPIIDQLARPFRPGPLPYRSRGPMAQRGYKQFSGQRYQQPQGVKRNANSANLSPGKASKREDINVPFRQKDTDCQIIAVANRNEGMPIIANIQGGTKDNRSAKTTPVSDSTIHLSDSITLSVRPNNPQSPKHSDKEQSGGVANLLASRGITVTPAAGEKDGSSESNRSERRLPSASELNLSSAISVHPPTSRDREGFAVPLPPSNKSSPSPMERPPRPPTVDLTRDANRDTRASCSQCDKIFPTEALLADHAKVHQQQAQSRMPFKCHLCSAGYSSRKSQQQHYAQFHQLHLSAGDLGIPIVDLRNPSNIQKMQRLGIRSFLPLNNLQNRGAGGVVGIPILSLENLNSTSIASLQQWGINDVLSLGPPKTINHPR